MQARVGFRRPRAWPGCPQSGEKVGAVIPYGVPQREGSPGGGCCGTPSCGCPWVARGVAVRGSPYGVLLNEVRFAIPNELFTSTTTFGAEEIAFSIWAHVHGMAVLETTHLRGFDVDFAAYHPEALRRLLRGFTPEPN